MQSLASDLVEILQFQVEIVKFEFFNETFEAPGIFMIANTFKRRKLHENSVRSQTEEFVQFSVSNNSIFLETVQKNIQE